MSTTCISKCEIRIPHVLLHGYFQTNLSAHLVISHNTKRSWQHLEKGTSQFSVVVK